MNSKHNNFPVDLVQDHSVIEVKAGLVSNSSTAQHWRATIGKPGKEETAWLKTASSEAKRAWNKKKEQAILQRKEQAAKSISKVLGKQVKARTMTVILNPDNKTADLFEFKGFHLRIRWDSPAVKKAYVGSFKYDDRKKEEDLEQTLCDVLSEIDNFIAKYSEDQPRDEGGRFASTGEGGDLEARPDPTEIVGGKLRGKRVYSKDDVQKKGDWYLGHTTQGGAKWSYTYHKEGKQTVTDKELEKGIPDGFPHSAMQDAMKRNPKIEDKPVGGTKPPITVPTPKPIPTPKPEPTTPPPAPKPQPRVSTTGRGKRPVGQEVAKPSKVGDYAVHDHTFNYGLGRVGTATAITYMGSGGSLVTIAERDLGLNGVPDDFPAQLLEELRQRNPGALIGTPHLDENAPKHMSYETIESYRQTHLKAQEEFDRHVDKVRTEAEELGTRLRGALPGTDEWQRLAYKRDDLISRATLVKQESGYKDIPKAKMPAATLFSGRHRYALEGMRATMDTWKATIGSKSPISTGRVDVQFGARRAFARSNGNNHTISIHDVGDTRNFYHEMGHCIEAVDKDLEREARDLKRARTEGERPISLKSLHPAKGYSAHEMTLKDKWIEDYVGKEYPFTGSEVVSMGMELMHTKPGVLAKQDPQLYHLIMRGILRRR
jgi:hypothetical protein